MHILVVDDELDIVELISNQLEKRGCEVTIASCGDEAIAHIDRQSFDLIISDILMPNGNGMKVYTRAKEVDIPIVFVSGFGDSYQSILPEDATVIEKFDVVTGKLDHLLSREKVSV